MFEYDAEKAIKEARKIVRTKSSQYSSASASNSAHLTPQREELNSIEALQRLLARLDQLPDTSLEILSYHPIPTFTLTGEYDGTAYRLFLMAVDAIHEHAIGVAKMRQ